MQKKIKNLNPPEIKNKILIALDLDDCIIPWMDCKNNKQFEKHYIIEETLKNIKIVSSFCQEIKRLGFNINIVLSSSWSCELDDNFNLKPQYDKFYERLWKIIFNEIKDFLISKDPFNDRLIYINSLIDDNFIIAIDDRDLSSFYKKFSNFFMIDVVNGKNLGFQLNEAKKYLLNYFEKE